MDEAAGSVAAPWIEELGLRDTGRSSDNFSSCFWSEVSAFNVVLG